MNGVVIHFQTHCCFLWLFLIRFSDLFPCCRAWNFCTLWFFFSLFEPFYSLLQKSAILLLTSEFFITEGFEKLPQKKMCSVSFASLFNVPKVHKLCAIFILSILVKLKPKCSQNVVKIKSKRSLNAVKMQSKFSQNQPKRIIKFILGHVLTHFQIQFLSFIHSSIMHF